MLPPQVGAFHVGSKYAKSGARSGHVNEISREACGGLASTADAYPVLRRELRSWGYSYSPKKIPMNNGEPRGAVWSYLEFPNLLIDVHLQNHRIS